MRYLGLDVHATATVWCLLDEHGEQAGRGKLLTTGPALATLVQELSADEQLLAGQEIGTQSYFVHDVVTAAGVELLSFGAHQLRMIAASRKKTDKRDAYWIAKTLQTGMMPHPVYIPLGAVRRLRQLLSQRESTMQEQKRWIVRARASVRAAGHSQPRGARSPAGLLRALMARPEGVEELLADTLARCERMHQALSRELEQLEATVRHEALSIEAIRRLQTIPAVGFWTAVTIYAWVGDVRRFPSARRLTSYAGLVPSVHNSGDAQRSGGITKQGSPALRRMLVQAAHVLLSRCKSEAALPLQAPAQRVLSSGTRRKIAVVAAARHLLRVAYYLLRDETVYEPARLRAAAAS